MCEVLVQPEGKTNDVQNIWVMIINPEKKKEYTMIKRSDILVVQMALMETMKKVILSCFPHDVPNPAFHNLDSGMLNQAMDSRVKRSGYWMMRMLKNLLTNGEGKRMENVLSKGKDKKHTKRS